MSNPKFLKIPPKKQITFRVNEKLYNDFVSYAEARGLNQTQAGTEILKIFFSDKTTTNDYLTNIGGVRCKIPLDMDIKRECIENKTILNRDNDSNTIGDNTIGIKINRIPNNLDIITSDGYKANKDGVLHWGIDFILNIHSIQKPTTLHYNKLNIDLLDYLYCFCFEVKADNTTDVYLINPYEAINKLSSVNNRTTGDELVEMVEQLEEIQQQANYNYKVGVDNLTATNKTVSNKKLFEWLDTSFMLVLQEVNKLAETYPNNNIELPKLTENTPTRLVECSTEENTQIKGSKK